MIDGYKVEFEMIFLLINTTALKTVPLFSTVYLYVKNEKMIEILLYAKPS